MKCLHICNDFLGSKVHENLYKNLGEQGVKQAVFYPLRKSKSLTLKNYKKKFDFEFFVSKPLQLYHRAWFEVKIRFLYKSLTANINVNDFDIIHATTLFSDGAIALKLKKKYGTPYIVAVRATDIDGFLKYRPDLIFLAKKILSESTKLIFISNALQEKFLNHRLIRKEKEIFQKKCMVINNGIDAFWLDNQSPKKEISPTKILYVGSMITRKNAVKLIQGVKSLVAAGKKVDLTLVGEGGNLQAEVENLAQANPDFIKYEGGVYDKSKLKKIYNKHHIFALPSDYETFGLVYLEALSQGLPVLYLENEGIDGLFDFEVGEVSKSSEISQIATSLDKLIDNYPNYELSKIDFSQFSWKKIAKTYINLFETHSKSTIS